MSDMNESSTKIVAIMCGILCFTLISGDDDSNYEKCYDIGRNRICYHTETRELRSWNESVQICDSLNSSLPFFQTWDEQMTFNNYSTYLATNLTISDIWTCGQRHVFDNWTSVYGDIWNNYIPIQESSDGWQYQSHVMMTGKADLIAQKPSEVYLQMCRFSGAECKNVEEPYIVDDTCMKIAFSHDPWYEARNQCLLKGGDLFYVSNQRVIDRLRSVAADGKWNTYKFWIGIRKITWLWKLSFKEQPKEVTFTHWNDSSDYERISSRDLCIYVDKSTLKWKTSDCNETNTVICQRREAIEPIEDASSTETTKQIQSDWTNYVTVGSVIGVALVLCVASITIAVLIVRRKSSVAGENTEDDTRYQGLKNAPTYSARGIYNHYDHIDTDNGCYEDIANFASDGNYESIVDALYLEPVDIEVYDNIEEVGDDTEADGSPQLKSVTEENVYRRC